MTEPDSSWLMSIVFILSDNLSQRSARFFIVGYSAVVDFVESADVAQVAKRTNLSAS